MSEFSIRDRARLWAALVLDDTLARSDFERIASALEALEDDELPDDLTDVGDGRTPAEIVAVAWDYYFG